MATSTSSALKVEAAVSSKTFLPVYETTQLHMPENDNLEGAFT
jgi:hypothetical protein